MGNIVKRMKTLLWVAVGLVLLLGPLPLETAFEVRPPPEAIPQKLEVRETPTELRIELPGDVLFDSIKGIFAPNCGLRTRRFGMKIVVIGGSGLIGTKLVNKLCERGHEVVAASPNSGVNTITGEGLAEALAGAQVVVDVANSPSFEDKAVLAFFETSGRNLLAAEAAAGVGHHVALSVVGTDRLLQSGYFRAKMAQEDLIKASKVPYTILRSTQFFEFVSAIAQSATDGQTVHLSPALMQPIASDDVATAMADVTVGHR